MGIQKKNRRKLAKVAAPVKKNITPISIDAMILEFEAKRVYFKRLRYKGCPKLKNDGTGCFRNSEQLIDMGRDGLIREVYELFTSVPVTEQVIHRFSGLATYFSALDHAHPMRCADFSEENILWYRQELLRLNKLSKEQGGISAQTVNHRLSLFRWILENQERFKLRDKLTLLKPESKPHSSLSDDDFKSIGKFLHKGYNSYMSHIISGTSPKICPLFDEDVLLTNGFTPTQISQKRTGASTRVSLGDWRNQLVRFSLLLTCMFTGINSKPLYTLRRCDVYFKKGIGDHFDLVTQKGRALYKEQVNSLGFTHFSKRFMEQWLTYTEAWSDDPNALVFPYFRRDQSQQPYGVQSKAPQVEVNKILTQHGLPNINPSIFRKTRSQMLMRVLNDVVKVAEANNNSVAVTERDYLHGVESQHQRALAGAHMARFSMVQGVEKKQAIDDVQWACKDPLTELEYIKIKNKRPLKTKTGLGCEQPLAEKINTQRRAYQKVNPDLDTCIDFLSCFDCPSHALVAETDDIWMMLSFHDTLRSVLNRPSVNSVPSKRFNDVCTKVSVILTKLQAKAPKAFAEANELNDEAPHPLYADDSDIDDLLRIYGT